MKTIFLILAMLIVTLASAPTMATEQNDGVHVIPARDGTGKYELRPGQFKRGAKFSEQPKGWVDGDPCWRYGQTDNRQVWEFVCD